LSAGFLYTTISGVNASPALNYDFSVSTFQLLTTNLRFDEKNDRQKLNFAPLKLRRDPLKCSAICELTLNLVRSKDGFTFGLAHSINPTAPYTGRARQTAQKMSTMESQRPKGPNESDAEYAQYLEAYRRRLDDLVEGYSKDLVSKTVVVTYGANIQTF